MRLRILSLAILCSVAAALVPAAASAKLSVGISDNHPTIFGDPNFQALGAKRVRLVASWNAVAAFQAGTETNEVTDKLNPYIAAAQAQGVEVMVALEHSRGAPLNCGAKSSKKFAQCKAPSVGAYKSAVTAFVKQYPSVKYITAWNESNHNTQPVQNNPKRAGQYAKAAEQACKAAGTCKVIAMDILDSANNPKLPVKKLKYTKTASYIKKLRKAYGKTPAICGIHNYADVNRFRTKGTKALTKAMRCKSYWLTETGGFYKFASFWKDKASRKNAKKAHAGKCTGSANCQVAALNYLFKKTVKAAKHIDRAYIYNFYSGDDGRFDAGLTKGTGDVSAGKKRPGYSIVKKHL
jgi:hypothetical protein